MLNALQRKAMENIKHCSWHNFGIIFSCVFILNILFGIISKF